MAYDPLANLSDLNRQQRQQQPQTPQPQPGLLQSILSSVVNSATALPRNIGAAGYEGLRAGAGALANLNGQVGGGSGYDALARGDNSNPMGAWLAKFSTSKDPFRSEKELQTLSGRNDKGVLTKDAYVKGLVQSFKDTANTASLVTPYGKGAGILSNFVVPGAVQGGLQSFADPNSNLASVGAGALTGGATAGVLAKILPGIGGKKTQSALENLSTVAPNAPAYVKAAENAPLAAKLGAKTVTSELSYPSAKLAAKFGNEPAWTEVLQHNPPTIGLPQWLQKSQKLLENVLQESTQNMKTGVDKTTALSAARKTLESSTSVTDQAAINNALRDMTNITDKSGGALQAARALDQKARALMEQGGGGSFLERLLKGMNPKNTELQGLAHAYSDGADALIKEISAAGKSEGILQNVNLQKYITQAGEISPRLAEQLGEVLKNGDIGQLRSMQAPFINTSQQLLASKAAGAATSNAGINQVLRRGLGAGAGFGVGGPLGAIAGGVLGPTVEAGLESAKLPIALTAAKGIQKVANVAGAVAPVAKAIGKVGGNPLVDQLLLRGGVAAASQAGANSQQPQSNGGVEQLMNDPNNNDQQTNGWQQGGVPPSPYSIAQPSNPSFSLTDYLTLAAANPQAAGIFKDLYTQGQKQNQAKLSTTAASNINLAQNGLTDLEGLKSLLASDKNTLLKQFFPDKALTREYDSTSKRIAEAIVRIQSGANAPATEVARYQEEYLPKFGDSQKVIDSKLNAARRQLQGAMQLQSSTAGTQDYSQLLSMLGGQ